MKIFAGSSCEKLAGLIGKLGEVELSRFPNGENKVWIKADVTGETAFVMQNFCAPVDQNIMQFCLMVDALKRLNPKKIVGIIPWLGYAKQNKVFRKGESLAAEVVARIISSSGVDEVVLLDVHSENVISFFTIPVDELTAVDLFLNFIESDCSIVSLLHCSEDEKSNVVVVSPDKGALERNKFVAEKLGIPLFVIDKERDLETGEVKIKGINEHTGEILNIAGRSVLMFDDMILSGGTLIHDVEFVKSQGAKDVYFFATHLNISENTIENLRRVDAKKVVVTNSLEFDIPRDLQYKIEKIGVSKLFLKYVSAKN